MQCMRSLTLVIHLNLFLWMLAKVQATLCPFTSPSKTQDCFQLLQVPSNSNFISSSDRLIMSVPCDRILFEFNAQSLIIH